MVLRPFIFIPRAIGIRCGEVRIVEDIVHAVEGQTQIADINFGHHHRVVRVEINLDAIGMTPRPDPDKLSLCKLNVQCLSEKGSDEGCCDHPQVHLVLRAERMEVDGMMDDGDLESRHGAKAPGTDELRKNRIRLLTTGTVINKM